MAAKQRSHRSEICYDATIQRQRLGLIDKSQLGRLTKTTYCHLNHVTL